MDQSLDVKAVCFYLNKRDVQSKSQILRPHSEFSLLLSSLPVAYSYSKHREDESYSSQHSPSLN